MSQALPHPDSYTAYAFTEVGNGKLQKITVPWRDPTDNEVVVKVLACGVCGRCGVTLVSLLNTQSNEISKQRRRYP